VTLFDCSFGSTSLDPPVFCLPSVITHVHNRSLSVDIGFVMFSSYTCKPLYSDMFERYIITPFIVFINSLRHAHDFFDMVLFILTINTYWVSRP